MKDSNHNEGIQADSDHIDRTCQRAMNMNKRY